MHCRAKNSDWAKMTITEKCSKNGLLYTIWNLITLRIWELLGQPDGAKTTPLILALH